MLEQPRTISFATLALSTLVAYVPVTAAPAAMRPAGQPTAAEAKSFIENAEKSLLRLGIRSDRADWVQSNFITQDTEQIAAETKKDLIAAVTDYAIKARRYNGLKLPDEVARKLELLRLAVELPAPTDPAEQTELTEIAASMESTYGKGKYCPKGQGGATPT